MRCVFETVPGVERTISQLWDIGVSLKQKEGRGCSRALTLQESKLKFGRSCSRLLIGSASYKTLCRTLGSVSKVAQRDPN